MAVFVWKMARINLKSSLSMLNMSEFWSCLETFCIHQVYEILFPTTGGAKGFSFSVCCSSNEPGSDQMLAVFFFGINTVFERCEATEGLALDHL